MDGLSTWPTHLIRMTLGTIRQFGPIEILAEELLLRRQAEAATTLAPVHNEVENGKQDIEALMPVMFRNSALLELALSWLEEDLKERGPRGPGRQGEGLLRFGVGEGERKAGKVANR